MPKMVYKCITDIWKCLKTALNGLQGANDEYWVQTAESFAKISAEFADTEIEKFANALCIASLDFLTDLWRKDNEKD